MDAQYVKDTVSPAVVEGLAAVVRSQPADAVDYLGKFLIHYADHMDASRKAKLAAEEAAVAAAAAAQKAAEQAAAEKAAAAADPARRIAAAEASVKSVLEGASEINESVLNSFVTAVASMLGVNGVAVHIAEKTGTSVPEGEEGPGAKIKYLASTQAFVKTAVIAESEGGVTFKSWIMPEAPPAEEEPEEGAEPKPAPPPPELPVIHIANVLRDPAIVFHSVPRPGSYVAAPLSYNCVVHDKAVADGAAPTTAEDGSVTLPAAVPTQRSLAVCADTVASGASLTELHAAALKRCAAYLQAALEKSEAAQYTYEFNTFYAPRPNAEAEAAEATSALETALKSAEESSAAEVAAAGETAAEDVKIIIKSTAAMKAAKAIVDARLDQIKTHVASRRIAPKESVLKVLTAVWYMLGYTKESLADAGQPDATALAWPVARTQLGAGFVEKLNAYDPTVPIVTLGYAKAETVKSLLGEAGAADLSATAAVLPALAAWAKAALDLKDAAAAKRKREAEEAEAAEKAKAEAEAAAKAAAEGGGEE